jgi:hypothetical protein
MNRIYGDILILKHFGYHFFWISLSTFPHILKYFIPILPITSVMPFVFIMIFVLYRSAYPKMSIFMFDTTYKR